MTKTEFAAGHDGLHVPLTCEDHPEKRWSVKKISLSPDKDGKLRWNGSRSIFYKGHSDPNMGMECSCPVGKLYALLEDK